MFALFIILNKTKYLDDIIANFLDIGVSGATILDSQGMAGIMADHRDEIPMFGFLKTIIDDSKPYNKTIFTVLENEEIVETVVAAVKETLGDDAKVGAGFMFSVPLGKVYRLGE